MQQINPFLNPENNFFYPLNNFPQYESEDKDESSDSELSEKAFEGNIINS